MAYVPVPKDLTKVKTKVAFNLTKRQILCFTAALILGLPVFFLLKGSAGTSLAAFFMILIMLPFFLFAMYEKHGQPLEVILKHIVQTKFIRKKERPYRTKNYYAVLIRQRKLEKEVSKQLVKNIRLSMPIRRGSMKETRYKVRRNITTPRWA